MSSSKVRPEVKAYVDGIRRATTALMEQHVDPIIKELEDANTTNERREELKEEARGIVRRYTASFLPNFVVWLAQGLHTVSTADAKYKFGYNLEDEVKGKGINHHQTMLAEFARSIGAFPNAEDFSAVDPDIIAVRDDLRKFGAVQTTALMAALENTSIDFIPRLEKLAKLINPKAEITYTLVHGEADIGHADAFAEAMSAEIKHHDGKSDGMTETGAHVSKLLQTIFSRDANVKR